MSLTVGSRLGAYEILAVLGAGGMGVVYHARDSKLQRDVAVKVLPNELADDAERLARFRREAQLLASLNHANIGSIYGFEDADGSPALILELIEGPTLADRLALGAPPEVILPAANGEQFVEPEFLPGSKVVLVHARVPPNPGYIEAIDLTTGNRRRLVQGASPKLSASGDLLFVRQGRLWATRFNAERLEVVGSPVQLAESLEFFEGEAVYTMSMDGSLVYMTGNTTTSLVWLTPQGASTVVLPSPAAFRNPRLSPDGTRVAVNDIAPTAVSIVDLERGSQTRLTTEGYSRVGAWSPNGDRIAFFSGLVTVSSSFTAPATI